MSLGITQLWTDGNTRTNVPLWPGQGQDSNRARAGLKVNGARKCQDRKDTLTRRVSQSWREWELCEIHDHSGGNNDLLVWVFEVFTKQRK